ncbi:MAG: hypothetical protein PHR77_16315, partial [Kiritimatiellae bacterium]|nr:hypothetical protein [Kiritimatiellia bacterium]
MMKRALLIIMVAFVPLSSRAADGIWTYNGNASWTDTARWTNMTVAGGIDGIADFSQFDITGTRTITMAANRTIGSIIFADPIPGSDWVLTRSGSGQILTLDVTSGLPVINILNRTTTINTWIAGTKGFEKRGLGTLVLAATNYFTGTLFLNGGQTTLDFNGGYSPVTNIVTNTVALAMGGGSTLFLAGKPSTVNTQTFSSLTVVNGHNFINLTNGSAGKVFLNVGTISRQGDGFINFNPPTNGSIITTSPNDEGILGGYATIRTNDWAANNGTNTIVPYTAYFTNMFYPGFNSIVTTNCTMTNATVHSLRFNNNPGFALTLSGTNTIEAGGAIMFTTNSAMASRIYSGGWLTSGSNELVIIDNRKFDRRSTATYNTNIDAVVTDRGSTSVAVRVVSFSSVIGTVNGSMTTFMRANNTYSGGTHLYGGGIYFQADGSLGRVPASPQTNIVAVSGFNWMRPRYPATTDVNRIIHINPNAYLVVDGGTFLTINGEITGSGTLLQPPNYGGYAVVLNATNTLAGTVEINAMGLRAVDGVGLPTNSNLRLAAYNADQGILETTGTFTRALGYGPNQVAWGSSVYDSNYRRGGFAAVGGPLTVNIGGNATNLVWGSTYFNMRDYLLLGNVNSTHPVTWMNPIDLNTTGSRYIGVRGTAIMQGTISGNGVVDKFQPGTLILAATNTHKGGFIFETDNSRIIISFDEGLGMAPLAPTNNIFHTFGGVQVVQAGADVVIGSTRNILVGNNCNCTLDPSNFIMTVAGKIVGPGGFRKAGTGSGKVVLLGENSYWGTTIISNGDLVVNGSLPQESSVITTNGGFLGGTGVINGPVAVFSGSGLVPGGTTDGGTLTINNTLTMNSGSIYNWRYGSSPGFVAVSNQVTFTSGGTNTLRIYNPNSLAEPENQTFTIMTWPDSVADPDTNITWTIERPVGGGADNWSTPVVTMDTATNRLRLTFVPLGFPTVDNGTGPSSIMTNTAVLNGNYTSTGATAEVYIYWGTSDGGTNKDNWANVYANGETSFGTFSTTATGLYYGIRYYYRCYATNAVGDCWSPFTSSFTTQIPVPFAPGLLSGQLASSWNITTPNPGTGVALGPEMAKYQKPPWIDNVTYVYTGEIYFNGCTYCFVKSIDDSTYLQIDGTVYINNGSYNTILTSGLINKPPGWYSIEIRMGNGSGGAGYVSLNPGFQYNTNGLNSTAEADNWYPEDDGSMSLFRCRNSFGASLTNNQPSGIGSDSATFNAALSSSGAVSDAWVYWGTVDCTNNASSWANSAYVGSYTDVVAVVNYTPTGLTPDTRYYMRFRLTNQLMDVWSDVQVFNTTFAPSAYPYKTKITFSGYDKDETLTNFPALVVLSES